MLTSALLASLCALAGALALATAPALAARGHVHCEACSFKPRGAEALSEPSGVAVNESTGDVYVIDAKNNRVEYFDKKGEYQGEFDGLEAPTGPLSFPGTEFGPPAITEVSGIAIDNSTNPADLSKGDVYVADVGNGVIDKFTATGVYLNQLTGFTAVTKSGEETRSLVGIGVDPAGNLWAADFEGGVLEFNDAEANEQIATVTATLEGSGTFLAPGFAVDSEDNLYTKDAAGVVAKFSSTLPPTTPGGAHPLNEAFDTEPVSGLATELDSNDVYADHASSLVRLTPEGIEAGALERLPLAGGDGSGVAVSSAEHELYVAQAASGEVEVFTQESPGPPTVERETVSRVTGDSATLEGEVNPRSLPAENGKPAEGPTAYRFQYTTAERFEHEGFENATIVPGGSLAASFNVDTVTPVNVQGLAPGTVYRYRILATNAHGGVEGELNAKHEEVVRTLTTQGSGPLVLPDGREWELVSPPDKHGALLEAPGEEVDIQAAVGGGAFTYAADAPTEASPQGYAAAVQVLSVRGASGWSSRDLTIPHEAAVREPVGVGKEYRLFSEDLSHAVVQPFGGFISCGSAQPCLSEEASEQTPYVAASDRPENPVEPCKAGVSGCFQPLVSAANDTTSSLQPFGEEGECAGSEPQQVACGPEFVGASPDLEHVVVSSKTALTAGGGPGLYEWNAGEPVREQLAFISELPGRGPASGADLGFLHHENVRNAVSADGTRVFWGTGTSSGGPLYVRDVVRGESLRVGGGEAKFQDASADGSRVFYTETGSLYECHIIENASNELECEGESKGKRSELGSGVIGSVIGASEDGSWVYFVSDDGALAPGGVPGTCAEAVVTQPPGAECDLYVRHAGVTRLVAVLGEQDFNDWAGSGPGDLATLTGRVSPDGRWLAFMSGRSLTGYDNRDAASAGKPDQEVYLYHAPEDPAAGSGGAGSLTCASCNPSGARPVGEEGKKTEALFGGLVGGEAWLASSTSLAATVPGWGPYRQYTAAYQSRYLSNSGRLFFNAIDPLVPQAVNGNWDVYEYEPEGTGPKTAPCGARATSGSEAFKPAAPYATEAAGVKQEGEEAAGCVALISSGESDRESAFLDASGMGPQRSGEEAGEEAEDVFFLTAAKLSQKDTDNALDVYDAHECSEAAPCFPAPAVSPPECNTEASCKPAPEAPPSIYGAPASATFDGPGNLVSPPVKAVVKRALTRAQKLAAALKVCRGDRKKAKRQRCEKAARKSFGPVKKAKKK